MIIAAVLLTVFNNFNQPITAEELVYSDFIQEVQRGNITEVTITGGEIGAATTGATSSSSLSSSNALNFLLEVDLNAFFFPKK